MVNCGLQKIPPRTSITSTQSSLDARANSVRNKLNKMNRIDAIIYHEINVLVSPFLMILRHFEARDSGQGISSLLRGISSLLVKRNAGIMGVQLRKYYCHPIDVDPFY